MTTSLKRPQVESNTNLRLPVSDSAGVIPAAAIMGRNSSRMRPRFRAMTSGSAVISVAQTTDVGTDLLELFLDPFVATINVINAVDEGFITGNQARNHQAKRGA